MHVTLFDASTAPMIVRTCAMRHVNVRQGGYVKELNLSAFLSHMKASSHLFTTMQHAGH